MVTKINSVTILIAAAVATLLMLAAGTASLTTTIFAQQSSSNQFTAKLSGSNEVPPITTSGSGIASFQLVPVGHQETINYQLRLKDMTGVTGAHIHSGKQGENGPVVAGLFNPSMSGPPTGAINGQLAKGVITSSALTGPLKGKTIDRLISMIRSGDA